MFFSKLALINSGSLICLACELKEIKNIKKVINKNFIIVYFPFIRNPNS
jgi:hypothetical protein